MVKDMEKEILESDLIKKKVIEDNKYALKLYQTLCNNQFIKKGCRKSWSCSWRYAGSILARIQGKGDYLNWYCSGGEGNISSEVMEDLGRLGWYVHPVIID